MHSIHKLQTTTFVSCLSILLFWSLLYTLNWVSNGEALWTAAAGFYMLLYFTRNKTDDRLDDIPVQQLKH